MTAAAFSADGSVLAVAAESVITLWDPDNNALVGVIAETLSVSDQTLTCVVCFASALKQQFDVCQLLYLQPITNLSFVGTSVFLMSLCQSSRPEVTVWNVSNLSMQWAYSIYAEGTKLRWQHNLCYLDLARPKYYACSTSYCAFCFVLLGFGKNTICSSGAWVWISSLVMIAEAHKMNLTALLQ